MMLRATLTSFLYLLICLCASTHASRLVTKESPEYGVGFHLTLDYATASILYANGTAIDAAKIEGDTLYKQAMRQVIQDKESSTSLAEIHLPDEQSITATDINATAVFLPILQFLKLEANKHINTSLMEIYVTISSPLDDSALFALHSASQALGVGPIRLSIPAWQSALRGWNITSHCPSYKTWPEPASEPADPEQLVLVVEYTRAGLIAVLAMEECGFSMEEREIRNFTLGSAVDWEGKSDDLEVAIREVTKPPFQTGSSLWRYGPGGEDVRTRDDIAEVVVIGESANDEMLSKALESVFGEHWQSLKQRHDERATNVDPIFVAVRGAAIRAFEDLEWLTNDDWVDVINLAKESGE
ncbi:hypothetical protein VTO58DRAFT_110533 [Aureobasidium pullulans]